MLLLLPAIIVPVDDVKDDLDVLAVIRDKLGGGGMRDGDEDDEVKVISSFEVNLLRLLSFPIIPIRFLDDDDAEEGGERGGFFFVPFL